MCGLSGYFQHRGFSADTGTAVAQAMARAVRHRGPDDTGIWLDAEAGVAFGFQRLAIVDLSAAGHQPMVSASGRWVIILNGEIYNHAALRQEIIASGSAPPWRGHSD